MLIHLFVKVFLLLLYLVILVALVRLLDISAWCETGFLAAQLVDPLSLSVRKLKLLLESRGVAYEGILERDELVKLAGSSGDIAEADLSIFEEETQTRQQKSEEFNGRAHFLEEVEDKKDSIWLIQVIPVAAIPLLNTPTWKSIIQKVSVFGIRTGIFACARDIRFCHEKGWNKPFVLLAMPDGQQYKDHVVMRHLTTPAKAPAVVVDWINGQLSSKLTEIKDEEELCDHWLEFKSKEETSQNIRAVVFTSQKKPTLLFSALSMRYSGRIKFGFYNKGYPNCIDLKPDSKTHVVIVTSSGVHKYGHKSGEFLNVASLHLYFHTLAPEINDVFIISFVAVNVFCFLDLFLTSGGLAKIFLCFFWQLAKLNLLFILLWLPLQWLFQLPVIAPLSNTFWWMIQIACQTGFAGQLRQDWLMHSHHWCVVCGLFCLYCFVFGWFIKRCRPQSQEDNLSSVEWMRLIFHQWHLFMIRPRNMWPHGGSQISSLEEGMDLFLDRTTPDLWLHPVITGEYIHNLPRWKFGGFTKPPRYSLTRLCSSCQETWKKYSCMKEEGDNQVQFEKSCEQIRKMFAEKAANPQKTKISDLSAGEFYKAFEGDHDNVIQKQPEACDTNIYKTTFCPECLDFICHGDEAEGVSCESVKKPPILYDCTQHNSSTAATQMNPSDADFDTWPEDILKSSECAICLEGYIYGSHLCGLPCGHAFHFNCVQTWLCGGKHCCPTCRWPAFKRKPSKLSKYKE